MGGNFMGVFIVEKKVKNYWGESEELKAITPLRVDNGDNGVSCLKDIRISVLKRGAIELYNSVSVS